MYNNEIRRKVISVPHKKDIRRIKIKQRIDEKYPFDVKYIYKNF
jgi:hypothetical protein